MVVFKATLSFTMAALGIFIMRNQAATQRNLIKQKLPTFDISDPCWSCKSFEEDQKVEDNLVSMRINYYYNLHILNTINLLKHLYNYSSSNTDQAIMPSMRKRIVESKPEEEAIGRSHPDNNDALPDKGTRTADGARLELEVLRTLGGKTGAHDQQDQEEEQDQDKEKLQDQNLHQDQHQQEYEWKKVEEQQADEEPHGRQSGVNFVQDHFKDQDQHQELDQDQYQEQYERNEVEQKQGRDNGLVTWRKKMLRRMG